MCIRDSANVDERFHIEKSTEAACKYLLKSKETLGSWTLAAAAYNAGNRGVSRRLKNQQVKSYYDLLLSEETSRYVFRILALKQILRNPKAFGFHFEQKHLYKMPKTYEITIDSPIANLASFAKKYDMTYQELKTHNTWLRENHLNNSSRKKYKIKILKK